MIELKASAHTTAEPNAVWKVMCDTGRYANWVVATDAVTRTDGPAHLRSTYAEVNPIVGPWKARTDWTVIEFDAPRRQVHRTHDIPLAEEFVVMMEVFAAKDGSEITITLRCTPARGRLGTALFKVLERQARRDNETTVQNLARLTATGRV